MGATTSKNDVTATTENITMLLSLRRKAFTDSELFKKFIELRKLSTLDALYAILSKHTTLTVCEICYVIRIIIPGLIQKPLTSNDTQVLVRVAKMINSSKDLSSIESTKLKLTTVIDIYDNLIQHSKLIVKAIDDHIKEVEVIRKQLEKTMEDQRIIMTKFLESNLFQRIYYEVKETANPDKYVKMHAFLKHFTSLSNCEICYFLDVLLEEINSEKEMTRVYEASQVKDWMNYVHMPAYKIRTYTTCINILTTLVNNQTQLLKELGSGGGAKRKSKKKTSNADHTLQHLNNLGWE